tara:strand:+ start:2883 stop:3356 length:474 start_codon:yes stop_codon:yes gene_type:complete
MIFFKSNMKLLDICDDVLFIILNELYRIRGRRVIHQLKNEWIDKRPWFRVLLSGRRAINEGRAFLSKTPNLKDVELIQFESKCYIANILLHPFIIHRFDHYLRSNTKYGLKAYHTQNKVRKKIHELCKKNHWEDLKDQTDQTIVRYLIEKEDSRKYY